MSRPRGSIIGAKPTWTTTATSGIFSLGDVADLKAAAQWPRGPVAPTNLAGTPGDGQVALTWTAPATTHGELTGYVVQYSSDGGVTWADVNFPVIAITSQPTNQTAASGAATFSVTANVTLGETLSYQWQKQESGAGEFADVSGATSSTLALTGLTQASDDADVYRVVVSAGSGAESVTSDGATLTVPPAANITTSESGFSGTGTSADKLVNVLATIPSGGGTLVFTAQVAGTLNVTWSDLDSPDQQKIYINSVQAGQEGISFNNRTSSPYTVAVTAGQTITFTAEQGVQMGIDNLALWIVE
jgi:hypothetical protein